MKKTILKITAAALVAMSLTFVGCSKDEDSGEDGNNNPNTPGQTITAVPSTFTQKVMIEEPTGAWCGWCVLGSEGIKTAEEKYPGRVNAVALHGGSATEPMLVPEYASLMSFAKATGVPHYRLNRGTGGGFPGAFATNVDNAMNQVASCGLAIDALASSGNEVKFTVHAGFKEDLTGDYRLLVYLVEETVQNKDNSKYNQSNYVSNNADYKSSYYYSQPSVINNFPHKHVARKLLSSSIKEGDKIPAENVGKGKVYAKTYTFSIPSGNGWNPANIKAVAGILKYDSTCAGQKVLNSQSVTLGALKNWD